MANQAFQIQYNPTPAALLHRAKLALRTIADLPAGLVPLPGFRYAMTLTEFDEMAQRTMVKAMAQVIASAIIQLANELDKDVIFVSLVRIRREAPKTTFSFMCPLPNLLPMIEDRVAKLSRRDSSATDNATGLDIQYQFMIPLDVLTPVVWRLTRASNELLIVNRNHLDYPGQFVQLENCDTTSGLLNLIGTLSLLTEVLQEPNCIEALVAQESIAIQQGMDEGLRWLYCLMETGQLFDPKRLLINPEIPESYIFNYP